MKLVFLASYPRSGNTFLRTILNRCFNLKSASVYPNDLGHNKKLEADVGHLEWVSGGIPFGSFSQKFALLKTHALQDEYIKRTRQHGGHFKAIYIMRDARPAALSLYNFFGKNLPMEDVICGHHKWGRWSDHLLSWTEGPSQNHLILRYEDLISNFEQCLEKISEFLDIDILSYETVDRNKVADGHWIRKSGLDWKQQMSKEHIDLCTKVNHDLLLNYNYI